MAYSANKDHLMANRFRLRFTFWLDLKKEDEAALAKAIEDLKSERTFASTIRDGIRLICDLRAGRAEVLFELFPWVKELSTPISTAPVDHRLQEQIARLEALLLAQGNVPIQRAEQLAPEKSARIEVTNAPAKSNAKTVAKNFVNSMASFFE